jgi:hypothetical protein
VKIRDEISRLDVSGHGRLSAGKSHCGDEIGGPYLSTPPARSPHPFDLREKSSVHTQNWQGSSLDVKRYRTFDCILIEGMWK